MTTNDFKEKIESYNIPCCNDFLKILFSVSEKPSGIYPEPDCKNLINQLYVDVNKEDYSIIFIDEDIVSEEKTFVCNIQKPSLIIFNYQYYFMIDFQLFSKIKLAKKYLNDDDFKKYYKKII